LVAAVPERLQRTTGGLIPLEHSADTEADADPDATDVVPRRLSAR
jgi:hypothetical protein